MDINEAYKCKSCSKESYDAVPLCRVLQKLDEHFARNGLAGAGRLLAYWENEARLIGDERGLLEILNELIGYYRRTNDKEKALSAVNEAFALIDKLDANTLIGSATVYLNGATTMKAFGMAKEAIPFYERAKLIYDSELEEGDYRFAAFYNNISSAYKDLGRYEDCESACRKAISILDNDPKYSGEIAVTYINLAHLYYDRDPFDEEVEVCLDKAWESLMNKGCPHDGDFAFMCSKCYPSFGYFGHFERDAELRALTDKIYEDA